MAAIVAIVPDTAVKYVTVVVWPRLTCAATTARTLDLVAAQRFSASWRRRSHGSIPGATYHGVCCCRARGTAP